MADPIKFEGSNRLYVAAPGTEHAVRDMVGYTDGKEVIVCWKLSDLERHLVTETGEIWLSIACGSSPPPVLISGIPLMTLKDDDGNAVSGYRSDGAHRVEPKFPADT